MPIITSVPRLLLIEGLPRYEGVSECRALYESLLLFQKDMDGRKLRRPLTSSPPFNVVTKSGFLALLENSKSEYIHVSAHGDHEDGTTWIELPKGKVYSHEIANLGVSAKVVFVSACKTWRKDLANAFLEAGSQRSMYYIAPKNPVSYSDALLFALLFYKKLLIERCERIGIAFNYAYSLRGMKGNYWYKCR